MTSQEFTDFLTTVFRQLAGSCEEGAVNDICIDWRHLREMLAAGHATYAELLNVCVWAKSHFGMGQFYRSQHELVFVWKTANAPHLNNVAWHGRNRSNVWSYPSMMRAGQSEDYGYHATVKPTALVADAIKDCSKRNGIVLDPFLGSGTTLIAAERTGRRARGMEIDPGYVDSAVRRWQKYTGKIATLAATGQSFGEVEDERTITAKIPPAGSERAESAEAP